MIEDEGRSRLVQPTAVPALEKTGGVALTRSHGVVWDCITLYTPALERAGAMWQDIHTMVMYQADFENKLLDFKGDVLTSHKQMCSALRYGTHFV